MHLSEAVGMRLAKQPAADFIAWEKGLYFAVTLGAYFSALAAFAVGWRRARGLAVLPIAWVLSFWLVHLVFEVQGRYFLATILLLPLLSALTLGFGTPRRSEAP